MLPTKSWYKLKVSAVAADFFAFNLQRGGGYLYKLPQKIGRALKLCPLLIITAGLNGCSSTPPARQAEPAPEYKPATPGPQAKRPGGYYKDDGPGDVTPPNLDAIPDAEPKDEPLHRFANNPYEVFGQSYTPVRARNPYKARGLASWYGKKFHGLKTASGEIYDMYGMTAAHPTLPIPSYVRVTNLSNSRSVVVRVNDRGPFHANRIIDLSYTAAHKLGYINAGSTMVEVERIDPNTPFDTPATQVKATPIPADIVLASATRLDSPQSGIYLQLGAFASQQNADAFHGEIAPRLADFPRAPQVKHVDGLYRVQIGPYFDEATAKTDAGELKNRLNLSPVLGSR